MGYPGTQNTLFTFTFHLFKTNAGAGQVENGTLVPACPESYISLLYLQQLANPLFCQGDQFVHCATVENAPLAGSLDFYELVLRRHHHVEINIGTRIFFVAEVKQYLAAY